MGLRITTEQRKDGICVFTLVGRLDGQAAPSFEAKLEELHVGDAPGLVIDMAQLDYMSSAGVRAILHIWKSLDAHNARFVMVNLQPQIKKVFEIINALPTWSIFASMEEADSYLDTIQKRELEKT